MFEGANGDRGRMVPRQPEQDAHPEDEKTMTVTLADVAARAQVSPATVSRVLNGNYPVAASTRVLALPMPPRIAHAMRRSLPTDAPVPAPTLPSATGPAAAAAAAA